MLDLIVGIAMNIVAEANVRSNLSFCNSFYVLNMQLGSNLHAWNDNLYARNRHGCASRQKEHVPVRVAM